MPAIADVYGNTSRMDPNTFGDGAQDPEDSSAYWRRRVFALGGVIAVVAVLAWACSGSGGTNSRQAAEQSASPSAGSGGPVAPLAQTGTPGLAPSASPSASDGPSASASPSAMKRHAGDPCKPGDVVVTADLGGSSYSGAERPEFRYTVVNTGELTCSYDIGGLELRITSGSDRIWSSTDCASGPARKKLKRGVPYTRTVTWNRTRSSAKCHETDEKARPGTYVVRLRGNHVKPQSQVFRLR